MVVPVHEGTGSGGRLNFVRVVNSAWNGLVNSGLVNSGLGDSGLGDSGLVPCLGWLRVGLVGLVPGSGGRVWLLPKGQGDYGEKNEPHDSVNS